MLSTKHFLKGLNAWKKEQYIKAEKLLKFAADKGDIEAQIALGVFYFYQNLIPRSIKYFTMAAEKGNIEAQYELAKLHKDKNETFKWLKLAAMNSNHPQIQYEVGMKYYNGIGVDKDYKEAFNWLLFSAKQGFPLAQNRLGIMYYTGKGVEKDYKKAKEWFKLAAKQNDETKYKFKRILYNFFDKYKFPETMPRPVDIGNLTNGISSSRYNLGVMYYKGKGVKNNYKKGYKWFLKSAKSDFNFYSLFTLGLINYVGIGIKRNYKEAIKWFKKMSFFYSNDYILGQMYYEGKGVKKNYKKASQYFKYAFPFVELGADDLFFLGNIYYFGLDSDRQKDKYIYAYSLYKKAAKKGNAHAKYMLGLIYKEGKNKIIGKDEKKALKCFKSAYEKGDDDNKLLFFNIK
jgi:TPR repeat protein